jgi:mRNA interferase RelE/StbE
MKVVAKPSFERDLKKLPKSVQLQALEVYLEITVVENLTEIPKIKKMVGYKDTFRIKMGDYRIGLFLEEDEVILARILHRKEIYKFFP